MFICSTIASAVYTDRASIQFDLLESAKSVSPQDAIVTVKDIMSRKNAKNISYLAGGIFTQPAFTAQEYLIRQKDSELNLNLAWQPLTVKGAKKIQVTYIAVLSYPAQPSFAHIERTVTVSPGETVIVTDAETPQGIADTRPVVAALRVDLTIAHYAYSGLGGIGAGVEVRSQAPVITSVQEGGAAQKAGLAVGDELREIDGRPTVGLKLDGLIRLVKGDPGTLVVLQVYRPSKKEIQDISIIRDLIEE
jgi:hypothetical protein